MTKGKGKTKERIMQAVISYIEEHKYPPTVREIAAITGLKSTSSVHHYLSVLKSEGRLETDTEWGTPRALRVPGYKFIKECATDEENKGR